jgi:hypothetical protein
MGLQFLPHGVTDLTQPLRKDGENKRKRVFQKSHRM